MPSLVEHEQTDNHSLSFGYYEKMNAHPNLWAKSFIEVPHSSAFAFQNGSFTLEFLFFKEKSGDEGTSGYTSFTRPIMSKGSVFNLYFNYSPSSSTVIITHPGGSSTINISSSVPWNLIGKVIHFVFVWEIIPDGGSYRGSARIYINGYLGKENTYTYSDTYPSSNFNSPILIGGNVGVNRRYDFHTSNFQMDQIAVYNRALSSSEIASHFSKVFPYDKMIVNQFATSYWTFGDSKSAVDFNVYNSIGSFHGKYIGTRQIHFDREQIGPDNLPSAKAASFSNGGMAYFDNKGSNSAFIARPINIEYSYELWFNIVQNRRGVIVAHQSIEFPFNGFLLQINLRDNQETPGSIQFQEKVDGLTLNSKIFGDNGDRLYYNDGNWHHCVVKRNNTLDRIQLWLDGELHDSGIEAKKTVTQPSQLMVMNSAPGLLQCNGMITKLAYYTYELQDHIIRSHAIYGITYRIRGIVTLLGIPYRARLRFYKSSTGEFIQEMDSDPNTGEYMAIFYNDSNIDILVFSPFDLSVRYRAYGPVSPSEFNDSPIDL